MYQCFDEATISQLRKHTYEVLKQCADESFDASETLQSPVPVRVPIWENVCGQFL